MVVAVMETASKRLDSPPSFKNLDIAVVPRRANKVAVRKGNWPKICAVTKIGSMSAEAIAAYEDGVLPVKFLLKAYMPSGYNVVMSHNRAA